ncbi:MAG: PaaI family thioesterase [Deltaproteobacteria bacterium]|nr:PaaI family thioesterase [Deltaproteobacteria bacterium]
MDLLSLTGLELMQALIDGRLPGPSMADTIPQRPVEASRGYIKFLAHADERHKNPFGGVHGGFVATVLDSVLGCAVQTALDAGVGHVMVDLAVKMLKPIPFDEELIAEGRLLHVSRTIGAAEGSIKNAGGHLLAHGTGTAVIRRP